MAMLAAVCLTLGDLMDCSPQYSVHEFSGKNTEIGLPCPTLTLNSLSSFRLGKIVLQKA